ncbi:cilia and flagella-associated protein 47-like isoform X3 [Haliotis rufescens]|uniref:cilia and flagella-associated protein 47-like isoform X3 n=1 Tax=Haliotis rufescens TaxID=6454 RepID=UPI00201EC7B3|nr:cilia and flagella-associated protein 47-like isoform X3 [Haliotis rufescens]
MEGDISGVRITPPSLEFYDTEANTVYQLNITVKNVSKDSKHIRYYGPKSSHFNLKVKNPEKAVAPGLCVAAVVEYEINEVEEITDRIVVTVDGDVIEIPVHAYPSQPVLEIGKQVDFGNIVANSRVVAREITLHNHGSKAGEFKIKYSGDKPLAVIPSSGTIMPKTTQVIKVEYVAKQAGKFEEVAKVKLEGQDVQSLSIRGSVVERALEVLSLQTEDPVQCIKFGSAYYGTDKTECALLYNNGPEPINFVAVLNEDAIAQELGVDLSKSTTATLAEQDKSPTGLTNTLTSLITAIPNQGVLQGYQKIPIFFRFSPRWNSSKQGWKCQVAPPPRKDFAIFMRLEIIGSSDGFTQDADKPVNDAPGNYAEIGLTGTALPVLLNISPATKYDFGVCSVGEHADILCTIKNESSVLPAIFQFRRIAHFTAHPPNGKISAGQTQDVIFSFAPHQAGTFKPMQLVDVIGQVADSGNPTMAYLQVMYTLPIQLVGQSNPSTRKRSPRFNPGITPYISNEVGMFVDTDFDSLEPGRLRNAVMSANKTRLHHLRLSKSANEDNRAVKVAFPNDRAHSIRPSDRKERFQTIFTQMERHTYVDPDYAFTDSEAGGRQTHRDQYIGMVRQMRDARLHLKKAKEFKETNNNVEIGIKSAAGLRPKRLSQEQIKPDPSSPRPPNADWKLLSTKKLSTAEKEALSKPVRDGLNAVPTTQQEKADCRKWLSPQQLHQLIIGPPTIDFSSVCLRSNSQKELNIINNLDQYIHVVAEIDCRELRQSSPLSQVVPPKSRATIPILFESNTKGKFQRSVMYTVNGFYKHHVTVVADVGPVTLQLSTEDLLLKPTPGLPADAGYRGVVTLHNPLNYPAEFTWSPNLGEKGTAFSIRPATGMVDAFSDLDCEVVWHPSFMAPEDGSFTLMLLNGNPSQFRCLAQLGTSSVQFVERRIMFGQVPVNLTTTRTALLHNSGQNHAFFQVLDPNPFPGLTVSPVHGVVPVGGTAELRVSLTPDAVLKFDTRVQLAIKGGKTIDLRMGGTVEPPSVDISMPSFNFGGVYCGSGSTIQFQLLNKTVTKAKMEFDLTRFKDFTLAFPGFQTQDDYNYQLMNQGMYSVTLGPEETVPGEITFMPSEVAAYDFVMPCVINHVGAPTPAPTPFPPTPAPSQKNSLQHIINPRPQPFMVVTPRKHVIATALRQPLQLSQNRIEFYLPPSMHEMYKDTGIGASKKHAQPLIIVNNSPRNLKWAFDLSKPTKALEDGALKFTHSSGVPFLQLQKKPSRGIEGELEPGQTQEISVHFCPAQPGKFECLVPVVLDELWDKPYQYLHILGELKAPRVWFDPLAICLTPVPLTTEVSCEFNILGSQYRVSDTLSVELPEVECEDGSSISPLTVHFPQGQEIKPCAGDEGQIDPCCIPCKVTFISPKPISFSQPINFKDTEGRIFSLMVTASSDNCLLTCYPFLALHRSDHQIGSSPKGHKLLGSKDTLSAGEAVLVPCQSPNHSSSRPSTSATSSNFQISSSSYESSDSVTDSADNSTPHPRDGAMNKPQSGSDINCRINAGLATRSLGSAMFPDEDTEEGIFHMEVLFAVQRWFSSMGWPGGPFPITIPESLRVDERPRSSMAISRKPAEEEGGKGPKSGGWDTNNLKKDFKTIYDMISHLSGRPVPGIPLNSSLPADPLERVKQIYWQHSTLLTFLRCQGACVAAIRPEHLMEPRDYSLWKRLQQQLKMELVNQGMTEEAGRIRDNEEELEEDVFEAVSKRAWTDILLQIYKSLVLAKITPRTLKTMASPDRNVALPSINPDPLSSNVYCVSERIVLSWLNHHFEHYRHTVWENCPNGGVPSSRWIVNYDFDLLDGLVFGAVLGAHMPFLTASHLKDMYTHPSNAEQCLHNALKVVNAMRYAGIDYDIQAIDITDPNPISLMLLSVHLYQHLPQYLPKSTVDFTGSLHATVARQVKLSNPSGKPLVYQVLVAGRDARNFRIPKGDVITVPSRSTFPMAVEFTSCFLRPAEAVLVLVGRRQGSATATTLTFNLRTQIDNITPKNSRHCESTIKVESPCYELERILLDVTNPFDEGAEFRIILVEASNDAALDPSKPTALMRPKEKKKKVIKSKVNHGQKRPDTPPSSPPIRPGETAEIIDGQKEGSSSSLSAFFSPMKTVYLEPHATAEVEIHFLPFAVGDRQCSVIFLNETVGEFLYSIEAKAKLPLPSILPFVPSNHSVRISSAAAAGSGRGMFGGDDRVIYWKCEAGQILKENLLIPVTNMAKERTLTLAAQQHMSDVELQRRHVTNTLMSCSVTAKTVKKLSTNPVSAVQQAKALPPEGITYTVETDSEYFKLAKKLVLPSPVEGHANSAPPNVQVPRGVKLDDGVVELPITFLASEPGHYPCEVVLQSSEDVRVYRIECTVNPEGSTAELDFAAPVHKSVTQMIPIMNMTNHDWPLRAKMSGEGFFGPPTLLAKAFQSSHYPLTFKPLYEKEIQGKLVLSNTDDGTDHTFHLQGRATKPLALEHVVISCQAKSSHVHQLKIPNMTKKKLIYTVESDISFVSGQSAVSVLQSKTGTYDMVVTPKRRGVYKGIIAFVAGRSPVREVDSDGDDVPSDDETKEYDGYRIWYSLELHVSPPPPERTMEIGCACQKKAVLEVVVRNPTPHDITLEAKVSGRDLEGQESITLGAGEKEAYLVTFSPAVVGTRKGSLVFYNEAVGEFWYELILKAEPPQPSLLPHMECELGRWTKQTILLENPTDEMLELVPTVSNINNFSLERDNERPLLLRPHSQIEVPLHFMPSTLGQGEHHANITFHSEQLGEWVFEATGTGQLPQPQDPVSVFTAAGTNTTLIIPFRNPLDHAVLANIVLTDNEQQLERVTTGMESEESPFCLLLKHNTGLRVGPKSTLDIPISFAPNQMRKYVGLCTVIVHKEDGTAWQYVPTDANGYPVSRTGSGGLMEIRWLFPVNGIPESKPVRDSQGAVIECRARESIEERLEVTLSGVAPSSAGPQKRMRTRAKTPKDDAPQVPDGIVVGETLATADEFSHELTFCNEDASGQLKDSVSMTLVRQHRDINTGLVVLLFNVKFNPFKPLSHDAQLHVTAATGGVWKFPLRFVATEPPVDDKILIEATGLSKMSTVGFWLTSQSSNAVHFDAFFESGSDPEFSISPEHGELLPQGTDGTMFNINFLPAVYGKLYQAKLVIQTPDMQWSYEIRGVLPEYTPPRGKSSRPMAGPHPDPRYRGDRVNYVRDNLQIITTAVSSPVKGAPLLRTHKVL